MFGSIVKKLFGSSNDREIKRLQGIVEEINALEEEISRLSDDELRNKTDQFKATVKEGFSKIDDDLEPRKRKLEEQEVLNTILPEAFAVVREAGKRVLHMRHFDVQLMGGVVLHEGRIAEMKTGEGKTLVCTLPVYLNALAGKGVHVVTVNDYLAKRDADWMGQLYRFLGLTVGIIQHNISEEERQQAYLADITYGTNNEFGFDYLRDNMKFDLDQYVQRGHYFGVVDEVDSILIDEARTPLIISGPAEESTDKYVIIDKVIPKLDKETDFQIEEKSKSVTLTEEGVSKLEGLLQIENLYDPRNVDTLHHVHQALKAHAMFKKDVDYVVKDGQVMIVDEFTGRLMTGRRWSDGLHQAVEAKEGVKIENENQTLATITFQNYFRLYEKLAGMTGTADTEASEFASIYNLEVVVIPTNRPLIRPDFPDVIYRTEKEKFDAIADEIEELFKKEQPVLVGTISINNSERISAVLKKRGVPHHVLNAKFHEKEAEIVAQAGRLKGVTIATNMAGRGTDILLGGNPEFLSKTLLAKEKALSEEKEKKIRKECEEQCAKDKEKVIELGGLHILGTERHESRRIDNQLRGRSGRQGDPGSSRFYLSLEDDLLRIFGSDRISGLMKKLGMEEGEQIEHRMVSKAIENAQKKVEGHNFGIRKHILEYDDVMNKQREVIYDLRREVLGGSTREMLFDMAEGVLSHIAPLYIDKEKHPEDWDLEGLSEFMNSQFAILCRKQEETFQVDGDEAIDLSHIKADELQKRLMDRVEAVYKEKEASVPDLEMIRQVERVLILQIIDNQWKDHLLTMDHLKEGIGFRGYAQKNPLTEYKREGFDLFSDMIDRIHEEACKVLFRLQIKEEEREEAILQPRQEAPKMVEHRGSSPEEAPEDHTPVKRDEPKVGRNDPCPCGSGKKYKKCHGAS